MLGILACRSTAGSQRLCAAINIRSAWAQQVSIGPLRQTGLTFQYRTYSTEPEPKKPTNPAKTGFVSRLLSSGTGPATSVSSFRKIIALAKPERKPLLTAVGLLFVSSTVSMSIPFTIGRLIDFFSSTNVQIPFGLSTWQASGSLLIIFTAGALANAGRAYLMKMSGQRIVARLREQTYSAALHQEVEFVERGEGDVLSRLSVDTSIVGESVTQNLSDGLRAVVMSFVGLGAMFYLSPTLTTLMLCVVPPISFGAVFYGRYLKKLSNRTQEAMGEMSKHATESLSALRTVQAYNAQPQEELKFHERVTHVLSLAKKEAIASGIFFGSTGWSGNITILALLGYGGSLVSQGQITVGDLTSLLLYTVYVGSGLQMLTSFFSSIMRGIGAGTRVFELLGRKPAIPADTGVVLDANRRGPVKFENVGFEYPSRKGVEILKDFDLEIGVGESVAIVGSSGSGKSSIQALLLRYYDPIKGKVTFDGQDIRELKIDSWRDAIGIVPQDPVLFTGTIASNIAFGNPTATREQIEDAAREANCEFVWGMPKGFDTEIGRLSLSGGQRQRLAIARALLKKPAILALDEATSALDANSEHRVNDAVDKILRKRQTTCLFVAHRLSTVVRAERIVVLEGGRIVESGTYRHLANDPDSRFRALMSEQLNATNAQQVIKPHTSESVPEPVVVKEKDEEVEEKEEEVSLPDKK
ncbi:P-loop containing nucleoside triphosphate hydrolase protein [Rhodocollybia butyracea]|uniref:P-loop containing nucleoside triphosphate hydrolase protein n=1 Tax=Rhodocollybia butyracea TaxID=206335 RepID=A0A9P5Q8I2_9AGAR|nr:P-loop containing nucleoside triphosphate hydrolase protein [Rhodocollybia butyracea]